MQRLAGVASRGQIQYSAVEASAPCSPRLSTPLGAMGALTRTGTTVHFERRGLLEGIPDHEASGEVGDGMFRHDNPQVGRHGGEDPRAIRAASSADICSAMTSSGALGHGGSKFAAARNLAVLSSLPVTSRVPSGLNATAVIGPPRSYGHEQPLAQPAGGAGAALPCAFTARTRCGGRFGRAQPLR